MNTMNNYYFFRLRQQHITYPKILGFIRKIVIVISVYLIFGLLFQYIYVDIKTDSNPAGLRPWPYSDRQQ